MRTPLMFVNITTPCMHIVQRVEQPRLPRYTHHLGTNQAGLVMLVNTSQLYKSWFIHNNDNINLYLTFINISLSNFAKTSQ